MPDEKYSRNLIIDTNALIFQFAFWIEMRIKEKDRRIKDSRVHKAHEIISKYSQKHITPTIKSEFFLGDNIKQIILEKIREMLGIRSRIALNILLDKPISKLKEKITEIPIIFGQSDLDSVTAFYNNIISTFTQTDEEEWKTGYGTNKPFMPEENDRKILTECIKLGKTDISLISNDRAFIFPKYKDKIESNYGIMIECL
jgi:hypothetical protein